MLISIFRRWALHANACCDRFSALEKGPQQVPFVNSRI
jgi:hypothetical protein